MIIRETRSVCPICLANVPARLEKQPDGSVFLEKNCPQHGAFRTIVWRGRLPFARWIAGARPMEGVEGQNCPGSCGLCPEHIRESCCVLLEVTRRCNLHCRFCFADAGGDNGPETEELLTAIRDIAARCGRPMLQLSGGEPTLRDDLPVLIRAAKDAGIPYVQVNTNGIRLAEDPALAGRLADAGLDFVFLQFDGTDDSIYRQLRGKELMEIKKRAVERSGEAGLGVTLVPTVVPDVNSHALGDIVRFAAAHSPVVRGVHFQPVSYFGRIPKEGPEDTDRCTLDELLFALCAQTGLELNDFIPSRCDHPLCGFHGSFIAEEGRLIPLTRGDMAPQGTITAGENREFVARHWLRQRDAEQNRAAEAAARRSASGEDSQIPTGAAAASGGMASDTTSPEDMSWRADRSPGDKSCQAKSLAACYDSHNESDNDVLFEGRTYQLRLDMAQSSVSDMDVFLQKVRTQSFTLSSMPFQDAMSLDMERLRSCSLHVYSEGKIVPLCAQYLTAMGQEPMEEEG